ncbi:MAG: endopeptidase La [Desulfobaccales bacterium]
MTSETNHGNNHDRAPAGGPPPGRLVLPILPTSDIVLFPRIIMPLAVWDEAGQKLVDDVLMHDKIFGVLSSRQEGATGYGPDNLFTTGTAAVILKMRKPDDGSVRLLIQGLYRFRLIHFVGYEPYLTAEVEGLSEDYEPDMEIEALVSNLKGLFLKMLELSPYLPSELGPLVRELSDPRVLADIAAGSLNISKADKQALLETIDVKARLHKVLAHVNRELEILELGKKIQAQVKSEMDKAQREYFLREQIKILEKELGGTDERTREIEELKFRLEEAHLPPHALKEAERELARLKRTPPTSPDHQVIRNYLEWMIELPWSVSTEDNLDLAQARKILDEDHYDLEKVKKRILEYLAVRKLKPDMKGPILCFVGPPGTGKTSLGRSIARALGRKFVRLSLGGVRDEAEIRGHRRTYVGALPGRIIQSMRRAGSNNPVFILDEVDKIGADFRGDPAAALLEVLDPEQNHSFSDHYLDVGFDLSKVMFITTANLLDPIPPALRDRMEVLELPGYTEEEKIEITFKYLIPRQLEAHGLTPEQFRLTEEAARQLIARYTREAGLRNLEREIAALCRAAGREIVEGLKERVEIDVNDLATYLGPPRFFREAALDRPEPGVATGLAWTPTGGDILFIEVLRMPGKGALKLTGQLGEVMKESAEAALSYIRARAPFLGVEEDFFEGSDLHIHVPAGAIPKDGPSAGLALLAALVSRLAHRPVKKGLAMTGEITLRGDVLPVGGIKNKVLAAHRAGIREIILPAQNAVDLEEIPEAVRKDLIFHPVERMDQALEIAFPPQEQG